MFLDALKPTRVSSLYSYSFVKMNHYPNYSLDSVSCWSAAQLISLGLSNNWGHWLRLNICLLQDESAGPTKIMKKTELDLRQTIMYDRYSLYYTQIRVFTRKWASYDMYNLPVNALVGIFTKSLWCITASLQHANKAPINRNQKQTYMVVDRFYYLFVYLISLS